MLTGYVWLFLIESMRKYCVTSTLSIHIRRQEFGKFVTATDLEYSTENPYSAERTISLLVTATGYEYSTEHLHSAERSTRLALSV